MELTHADVLLILTNQLKVRKIKQIKGEVVTNIRQRGGVFNKKYTIYNILYIWLELDNKRI